MASMTLTVPTEVAQRVVDGFAIYHGWEPEVDGQPNPESKFEFMKRIIAQQLLDAVVYVEGLEAQQQARAAQEQAARAEIQITVE